MNVFSLQRDRKAVLATLKNEPGDGPVYVTQPTKVYIPERYMDRGMAYLGSENFICGIFGIVVGDKFALNNVNAMVQTEPDERSKENIMGTSYIVLSYEPGSKLYSTNALVIKDTLVYDIYDEFLNKGKLPWFRNNYDDLAAIFDTAQKHGGTGITKDIEVTSLIVSIMARYKDDMTKYIREFLNDPEKAKKVTYIGVRNPEYAASSTMGRLSGAYFTPGLVASMVNPSDSIDDIEAIVRA